MALLDFLDARALKLFANNAEGIAENLTDDLPEDHVDLLSLGRILEAVQEAEESADEAGPVDVEIEDADVDQARTVLENLIDLSSGATREEDDPDWEEYLFEGDVTVEAPSVAP